MKIVLLESLGISQEILDQYAQKLKAKGHTFENYPKDTDPKVQIERAKDADILMIANMPLSDGLVGCELRGKTVGIVGAGAIGCRTAELCHAFGCKVLGYKRHVKGDEPSFIEFVSLDELLSRSDIVSLHCPINEDSKHLINAQTISKMKKGAYLINTARGPVVDSQALADALNNGYLSGAGIDVFEKEPPLDTDHPLLHSKNTIVTPHVAFASAESMIARADIVFDNIEAFLSGNQKNIIL